MVSALFVNAGNYLYNVVLGRLLGPAQFADAAILITLLLVLSFVAMTFQLTIAKFTVQFDQQTQQQFISWCYVLALILGIGIGLFVMLKASGLQNLFHTQSASMFVGFGVAIPFYFIMSINRGRWQGTTQFKALALTYQSEMLLRLVLTVSCILWLPVSPILAITLGIALSVIAGLFPFKKIHMAQTFRDKRKEMTKAQWRMVAYFFGCTAAYECIQIICNNSDILLVKHYFPAYEAGQYAALALIGRVVYFVTWMFVMLLLPKVVALHKAGKPTQQLLFKYVGYVLAFASSVVLAAFIMPELAIRILFGAAYLDMAPLLGMYALATALFALANIFIYYFLSLSRYLPVAIGALGGILQVVLISQFHQSLNQVVLMQIIAMGVLCMVQLGYFFSRR